MQFFYSEVVEYSSEMLLKMVLFQVLSADVSWNIFYKFSK